MITICLLVQKFKMYHVRNITYEEEKIPKSLVTKKSNFNSGPRVLVFWLQAS